ncbi:helicase with zinc finger domain 2-like isoform X3 [Ostrea edulis]|uniref:helicase with zinc finger domain 2-like isoform X3 n=1 Tax=Ostrea edulis TaxID=37623 RepID=UPI0024AF854A|nr:helicase with zinc finger domain 2-like isoform X3 [Ostrea edulis]
MSTDASDDELVTNFETVKTCLRLDCAKLLRGCLICFFPKIDVLKRNISENVKEGSREAVGKCKSIKSLSFQVLCDIFLCGTCNKSLLPPSCGWNSEIDPAEDDLSVSANILRLWRIWKTHISENTEEKLTDNDTNAIWSKLHQIGAQLSSDEDFHIVGGEFIESIKRRNKNDEDLPPNAYTQLGSGNSMGINIGAQTENSISCCQVGVKNKLIFQIEDQRQLKQLEIETSALCRIVARAPLTPVWQQIKDNVCRLNPTALNDNDTLKENCISFEKIEKGCLVIDVTLKNKDPLEENLQRIFQVLYDEGDLENVMQKHNTEELTISGYIYCPENYIRDDSRSTCKRKPFSLKSHHTLFLGKSTTCDVDLFMSELLEKLMENEFSTDANEVIKLEIKGEVIDPNNYSFSSLQQLLSADTEERSQQLNSILSSEHNICVAKIFNVKNTTVIHVVLKSGSQMNYRNLVEESGILFTLLRNILWSKDTLNFISEIRLMRIGLIADTSMIDEITSEDKGLVFYLTSESKISEAIENGTMTDILTAMLQGEDPDILKNAGELKIKAIIESGGVIDESSQVVDITANYEPEENFQSRVERAKEYLQSGNILEAKEIARNLFQRLSPEHVEIYRVLQMIFRECADNFYALKCFCLVRLLKKEKWNPLSLISSIDYWMPVISGPYEFEEIKYLFEEIEDMLFDYLKHDDHSLTAEGICCELFVSYGDLRQFFPEQSNISDIVKKRMRIVDFNICQMYFRKGLPQSVCAIYMKRERYEGTLDVDNLYLWALALKDLGKVDVALKKVEEAIQTIQTENVPRKLTDLKDSLCLNSAPETNVGLDDEWLAGTNISIPKKMKDKALKVQEDFKKKTKVKKQTEAQDIENTQPSPTEDFEDFSVPYEDSTKYRTWKDVPSHVPDPPERKKKRRHRSKASTEPQEDYNVEYVENESDSGQDSNSDNEQPTKKPFHYEAPEYQNSQYDNSSDSGIDTFDEESHFETFSHSDKSPSNSDLVIFGITLKDRCKTSFQKKKNAKSFQYQPEKPSDELRLCLERDKHRYKRCIMEIESAHKATCRNLDLTDDVKEILISGRSKCGRNFTDDEVVVEILGESKAQTSYIPRLKIDLAKERKDNNVYGQVIGRLKRNRYNDLDHPVLICAKDEFAEHMMKPLCRTVPKIKVSHEKCENNYQVDLFSFDAERNVVEYRDTMVINHAYKKSYCFLVAIMTWEDMYPFGITLKVINTKGDIKSGIGILKLQYRVPCAYDKETTKATEAILNKTAKKSARSEKVISVFTIDDGKQGPIETAYSVTTLESGLYRIGVHIVDPTSAIKKGDAVDTEARRRGTDFYVNKDIPPVYMIPERLSRELFSIELGKERKTLSVFLTISVDNNDISFYDNDDVIGNVEKATVKSEKRHSIREVQTLLKTKGENSDIKKLYLVSQKMRKQRIGNASFFTDINEMFPFEKNSFIENIDAYLLVQELHIFANKTVASYLFDKYPELVPCKCHNRPGENVLMRWKKAIDDHMGNVLLNLQDCEVATGARCSIFDNNLDYLRYRSLIPIQTTVWQFLRQLSKSKQTDKLQIILGADEIHPMQALAMGEWIEILDVAEYKCSVHRKEAMHFDLRVPIYTSFTAPLSRFIDLVVHRLVHAALDNAKEPPYEKSDIQEICTEMNNVNRIRKQFRKECLVLLFGHSLSTDPHVFNGFIQNVTNNDVELIIPTLRNLPRISKLLPINLLRSRQKPDFIKATGSDRYIMTIKWQNRLYSLKRRTINAPKENTFLRINPHQNVQFHPLKKWVNVIRALLNAKTKNIFSLMVDEDQPVSNKQIPEVWDTVNDVSSEIRNGNFAQQTCSYSLSFNYGQLLVIQMCAEPDRGIMTPLPQLLDITPNVKICLQHVRDPLGVLSSMATKSTKEKYVSCKEYIAIWMPIFTMEVARQTADDESFTINDLPVTFRERGGAFSLKYSFMEKRDIEFTAHSVDLLKTEDDANGNKEKERFYMPGSDFLCIRCPLEPKNDILTNFGNGAISPQRRYWMGHAQVNDVRFKTKKDKDIVSVQFVCHNKSPTIPPEMLNKKRECSVEILPKSDVSRRIELYVKWLESASELARAIALRRRIPELDKVHKDLGDQERHFQVPPLGIEYNENQKDAVKRALTSSFSLIQGPPGTGKTFTGVALINLFCSINRKYTEMKGESKHFVVFCGPSNKSVDLVTVYLKDRVQEPVKILRMYGGALECKEFPIPGKVFSMKQTESVPDETLRDISLHHIIRKPGNEYAEKIRDFDRKFKNKKDIDYRDIKEYKRYISKAVKDEIPKYDVILCTTAVATSSRLLNATARSIYQLVIDEAGMCTEPECLATIVATQAKQVVLIGDHKQLQPVVLCEEAGDLGLQTSLFERYAESEKSQKVLTLLTNQYRMHPSLCRFPSNAFYNQKLITKASPKWETLQPLQMWRDPKNPLVFCHIEGEEEYLANTTEEGNEMSKFNKAEIDQVEKVYLHLVKKEGIHPEHINIMSQYNAQCSKIRERLRKHHVQHVNTVVASQGGEWDYVVFSLVRSLPEYRIEPHPTKGWCKENLGFITDDHQINVALTRARKGLVIIGNKRLMMCSGRLKAMLDEYARHGCIEDAENFPPIKKRKKDQRRF